MFLESSLLNTTTMVSRSGVKVFGCDDSGSGGSDAGVRCEDAICRGC